MSNETNHPSATPTTTAPRLDGVHRHAGGCQCGAIRYQVELDLGQGGTRCNCTFCVRLGNFGALVKPAAFTLLGGQEARLVVPTSIGERVFCRRCGVLCYGGGDLPEMGGAFVSINLNTIDGIDPYALPVAYWDGRHNNWHAGTRPTPWPVHRA